MYARLAALKVIQKSTLISVFPLSGVVTLAYELLKPAKKTTIIWSSDCHYKISNCEFSCSAMDSFSVFKVYRNLGDILEDLSKHDSNLHVQQLLQVYNQAAAKSQEQEEEEVAKHPLIVLEGLDGSGKTSMTKRLASKFQAVKWLTPPESIRFLRQYFDDNPALRPAYYSLGNYIAALEISHILCSEPVILDRFWHSTLAYGLAQHVADGSEQLQLPNPSDEIYNWPADLLKPDIVVFLNVSEEARLQRHSRRSANLVTAQEMLLKDDMKFRQDVVQAFKNMKEPEVTIVNVDGPFKETLYKLTSTIRPLFKS